MFLIYSLEMDVMQILLNGKFILGEAHRLITVHKLLFIFIKHSLRDQFFIFYHQQEDARAFIDDMLKRGVPLSHIRKERTGIDMHGSRYW